MMLIEVKGMTEEEALSGKYLKGKENRVLKVITNENYAVVFLKNEKCNGDKERFYKTIADILYNRAIQN